MLDAPQKDSPFVLDDRDVLQRLKEFKEYCEHMPFQDQAGQGTGKKWSDILFAGTTPEALAKLLDGSMTPDGKLRPHQAFLLAFYKLLETPRRLLNAFPEAHRQMYYRKVLGLSEHGMVPDKVVVSCQLAENTTELRLLKGVELDAGQDSQGTPKRYQLDADLLANQSQWTDLRWVLPSAEVKEQKAANEKVSEPVKEVTQYAHVLFDKSGNIAWPQSGVRLFDNKATQELALQGRVVSSPVLMMAGGTRIVTVTFKTDVPVGISFTTQLSSGGKWLKIDSAIGVDSPKTLVLTVPAELGPITPAPGLDGYPLTGPMATAPLLKITRADGKPVAKIQSIKVDVKDLPDVLMSTDDGIALINKKSYPFGPQPRKGAGFNLVAPDWYNNPFNIVLTLTPQWADLPKKSFGEWYANYSDGKENKNDNAFKIKIGVFSASTKNFVEGQQSLFNSNTSSSTAPVGASISVTIEGQTEKEMPLNLTNSRDPKDWPRWVRVELGEQDFLHTEYPKALAKSQLKTTVTITKTEKEKASETWKSEVAPPTEINPPYTPQWQSLQVSYTSTDNALGDNQYLLTPFGYQKEDANTSDTNATPPQIYLGFTGIKPGQDLNLHWQLQSPRELEVQWQYLHIDNTWKSLNATVDDQTKGLFESGLWSSPLPHDAAENAPWMPAGRYWIRGVVTLPDKVPTDYLALEGNAPSNYPRLLGLHTNSITATLVDENAIDAAHFESTLPAFTITQTVEPINGIETIVQPWPSYGGRAPESEPAFLKRVAKHLENRGRVLTWRDITTLLSEKYAEVYDVRVVEPVSDTAHSDNDYKQPIQRLVVIPANGKMDNNDPFRPAFNPARLTRMTEFLRSIGSPWLQLQLENPRYTKVEVINAKAANVKVAEDPNDKKTAQIIYEVVFAPHVNADYAQRELQLALERQYMPWGSDGTSAVKIGAQLDKFEMIKFIQQLDFIDRVSSLTIKDSEGKEQTIVAGSSTEVLILTF